jgi:hypothetical protein
VERLPSLLSGRIFSALLERITDLSQTSRYVRKPAQQRTHATQETYPISSSASESGSAEVAMHYAFAACD